MAKALIGFVGGPMASDQVRETAQMRRRIADLEAEVLRLKIENDGLLDAVREHIEPVTAGDLLEPVLH